MILAEQSFWGYVSASYVLVFGAVAVYAGRTILRGRKVAQRIPADQRRWLSGSTKVEERP